MHRLQHVLDLQTARHLWPLFGLIPHLKATYLVAKRAISLGIELDYRRPCSNGVCTVSRAHTRPSPLPAPRDFVRSLDHTRGALVDAAGHTHRSPARCRWSAAAAGSAAVWRFSALVRRWLSRTAKACSRLPRDVAGTPRAGCCGCKGQAAVRELAQASPRCCGPRHRNHHQDHEPRSFRALHFGGCPTGWTKETYFCLNRPNL